MLIGGGGPRVLALAGREADIVGINPAVRSGRGRRRRGPRRHGRGHRPEARLGREAAGDRYDDIELNMLMFVINISDDRDETLASMAPFFQTTPEELAMYPHAWFGSVEQIAEDLIAARAVGRVLPGGPGSRHHAQRGPDRGPAGGHLTQA